MMEHFFVILNRTRSRILECIYDFSHSHVKICSKNELETEENPPCHSPTADYKPVM